MNDTVPRRDRLPPFRLWMLLPAILLAWTPYLWRWKLGLTSDAAVPYLMARDVLEGARPVYFWGQHYFGAVDAYVGALFLALFGRDQVWAADLSPLLAYALGAYLLVRGAPPAERASRALLVSFAPPGLYVAIARPGLSQGPFLWLCWAGLIALAPGLDTKPTRPAAFARAGAAGVVVSFATFYSIVGTLGAGAITVLVLVAMAREPAGPARERRRLARFTQLALVGVLGQAHRLLDYPVAPGEAVVGPAPVAIEGLFAKWPLLGQAFLQFSPLAPFGETLSGLRGFYGGLPHGTRFHPDATLPIVTPSSVLVGTALAIAALTGAVALTRRAATRNAHEHPALVGAAYWPLLLAFCVSAFLVYWGAFEIGGARYLAPLYFPLVACVAAGAARWSARWRRVLATCWCMLAVAGHVRTLGLEQTLQHDIDRAIAHAEARGVDVGLGDYWLSYSVTARARERLVVAPIVSDRHLPYRTRAERASRVAVFERTQERRRGNALKLGRLGLEAVDVRELGAVTVSIGRRNGR